MGTQGVQRRLADILSADVVGYSRLMGIDEVGTLAALDDHRAACIDPAIAARGGRVVKLMGDGELVEFPSVVDAVECAAAYAHLSKMEDSQAMRQQAEDKLPEGFAFSERLVATLAMCARQEDRDNWTEGFRKAGFEV